MDNNQKGDMQNWKKQIIMDPTLNGLFDKSMTGEELLNGKILALPHNDIIMVYTKLASLKHALTKHIQKEVEHRHTLIQEVFTRNYSRKYSPSSSPSPPSSLQSSFSTSSHLKLIERYNQKYQSVASNVIQLRNINKTIHFAKALERFKVNIRILRKLMKDSGEAGNKTGGSSSNNGTITGSTTTITLNSLKISKIIKELTQLSIKYDFTGLSTYETERIFVNNSKSIIYGLVEKEFNALISKGLGEGLSMGQREGQIMQKITILTNLNKWKDYIIGSLYKNSAKEVGEMLKKSFQIIQSPTAQLDSVHSMFEQNLALAHRKIKETAINFIFVQEVIAKSSIQSIPNLFQKLWENINDFIKNLITWNLQQENKQKENLKQNSLSLNLFTCYNSKSSRYINSTVWKYPILYNSLSSVANYIHLFIIKNAHYNKYDFGVLKEKTMMCLLNLAQLYYRGVRNTFQLMRSEIKKCEEGVKQGETQDKDGSSLECPAFISNPKQPINLTSFLAIVNWLLNSVRDEEIFTFIISQIMEVVGELSKLVDRRREMERNIASQKSSNLNLFLNCIKQAVGKIKNTILFKEEHGQTKQREILLDSPESMVRMVKAFRVIQKKIA